MFRITMEDGKPEQAMMVLCDNPRCKTVVFGGIAPGANKLAATKQFFDHLAKQGQWLIQPEGHYCPIHKHGFIEPVQRSLIVPVTSMPQGMRN
jgi:hypothetical protein